MARTLNSTDVSITLTIPGLIPAPRNVQGFAVDDVFMTEAIEINQTMMGVDGRMSFGQVPAIVPFQLTLMADSPSIELFELWGSAIISSRTSLPASAMVINAPGAERIYTFTKGVLVNYKPTADFKKVQQPVQYMIHWERLTYLPFTV